jgi:hypothetical protein
MNECIVEILSDLEFFAVANYIGLQIRVSPYIGDGLVLWYLKIGPRGRMNMALDGVIIITGEKFCDPE